VVLDFDHVRGEKVNGVALLAAGCARLDTLCAEMAKCEVRCVNCHRRRTHRTQKSWKIRIGASEVESEFSRLKRPVLYQLSYAPKKE
jgi:hypothetical protein